MNGRFSLWLAEAPLLLASGSATRRKLLDDAGIPLEIQPAAIDERAIEAGFARIAPEALALRLAEAKALAVSGSHPGRLVLGADQVMALGRTILHKPKSLDEARQHLARMVGRSHRLTCGTALARDGHLVWSATARATLHMRQPGPDFLERYFEAAGSAVLNSVGGYQLELVGMHLFDRVVGDSTTVLGLPMLPLLAELRRQGVIAT